MIFYKCLDGENVVNKNLVEISRVSIRLPNNIDFNTPLIKLNDFDFEGVNYVFLNELKRYYFIDKITKMGKVVFISLRVDLLQTYASEIMAGEYVFQRPIIAGDYGNINGNVGNELVNVNYEFDYSFDNQSLILVTLGSGVR